MARETKAQKQERENAKDELRAFIKPGDTIYTMVRRVARSGMSRDISLFVMQNGAPRSITHLAAKAIGWKVSHGWHDSIKVHGCGMDMCFHTVYTLSRVLFPGGFGCIGVTVSVNSHYAGSVTTRCPSNDHTNGDRDYTPHYDGTPRNSEEVGKDLKPHSHYHKDGGYALLYRDL